MPLLSFSIPFDRDLIQLGFLYGTGTGEPGEAELIKLLWFVSISMVSLLTFQSLIFSWNILNDENC